MHGTLTPDGALFLAGIATLAGALLLYVLVSALTNDGVSVLPDPLLLGWWGGAWIPGIVVVARSHAANAALLAHERCHHRQQARDGYIRWAWRYLTDKRARLAYEIEAYRVWLDIAPQDRERVLWWLTHDYGAGLSSHEVVAMLDSQAAG